MTGSATIKGDLSLFRKLTVMPDAVKLAVRDAMAKQAEECVDMMRRLAPKESGALAASIGWTWGGKVPQGAIGIAAVGSGEMSITIFAGSKTAYYARWMEFGTSPHSLVKGSGNASGKGRSEYGARHPGTVAQPFFFPSWRALRKTIRRRIQAATRAAVKKVASTS